LQEALEQKNSLKKISPDVAPNSNSGLSPLSGGEAQGVRPGNLVKTNRGYLFMSIALGKITVDEKAVMVISPQSPLGMKMMGLKEKDATNINGMEYVVERVY
jgi:hypothetical protein